MITSQVGANSAGGDLTPSRRLSSEQLLAGYIENHLGPSLEQSDGRLAARAHRLIKYSQYHLFGREPRLSRLSVTEE